VVELSYLDTFLGKKSRLFLFDELDYFEIVLKGRIQQSNDYRKYFIRMNLKNKTFVEFGYTWQKNKIKEQFAKILLMVKGILIPNIESYYIKDESEYIDYIY